MTDQAGMAGAALIGRWKPLTKAPKDGTWFLALPVGYVRPTACRWWAPEWDPKGKWCLDAEWDVADMGDGALWTEMPQMPTTDAAAKDSYNVSRRRKIAATTATQLDAIASAGCKVSFETRQA